MCVGVLPVWMSVLTFTVGPDPIKPSHERFHIGLYLEWRGLPERGCREQASLNILLATGLSQHLCPTTSPMIPHSLLRASRKSRVLTLLGSLFLHDASNFMKNLYSVHTIRSDGLHHRGPSQELGKMQGKFSSPGCPACPPLAICGGFNLN